MDIFIGFLLVFIIICAWCFDWIFLLAHLLIKDYSSRRNKTKDTHS